MTLSTLLDYCKGGPTADHEMLTSSESHDRSYWHQRPHYDSTDLLYGAHPVVGRPERRSFADGVRQPYYAGAINNWSRGFFNPILTDRLLRHHR